MPYTPLLSNLFGAGSINTNNLLPCHELNLLTLTLQEWETGQKAPSVTAVCKNIHKCKMYTIPAWKKNLVPAPHSQACIPAYYFLFSMAVWSWVSQAEIAIKGEDCPIMMCIPVHKEFCGLLMLVYHFVFTHWSSFMRYMDRGGSEGC